MKTNVLEKNNGSFRLESVLGKGVNKENMFTFAEETSFMNKI